MKTVLITGCSSGYGLETARHFHAQGWNVIATMRTPRADVLPASDRLRVLALDVTKPESIAAALEAGSRSLRAIRGARLRCLCTAGCGWDLDFLCKAIQLIKTQKRGATLKSLPSLLITA